MTEHVVVATELRVAEEGGGRTLTGIAVPYGEHTDRVAILNGEMFRPGAFKRNLMNMNRAGRYPKLRQMHDQRSAAVGTIKSLIETPEGLMVEARLADTEDGNRAPQMVREGIYDGFSVGFVAVREARGVNGVREIVEARMAELSLVEEPAYLGAKIVDIRKQRQAAIVLPPMPKVDLSRGFLL